MTQDRPLDVVVIGGGQAGLAAGYYLRRSGTEFVILDAEHAPGGAWRHGWDSLQLFSPASRSSLPGWPMPPRPKGDPTAGHVVRYLTWYEGRYHLPVVRPVRVTGVRREEPYLRVESDKGAWRARAVISATGTWDRPFVPSYPGRFGGRQLHTVGYRNPEVFAGSRVVVVGGGNSAAQIYAEVSTVTDAVWVTRHPPRFLPDDVDGHALFVAATRRYLAMTRGEPDPGGAGALGDIVMVPAVRAARERGVLHARGPFARLTPRGPEWQDGTVVEAGAIIWCTGFRPALGHLSPLRLSRDNGYPDPGESEPRLHLLGYGDWTGPASATLIGVGRYARAAVARITGR